MLASPHDDQIGWARSIQDARHVVTEPWRGLFKTLGRLDEFQAIEVSSAGAMYQDALAWCQTFGVRSERAVALMFDIRVQNGSIGAITRAQIERDFSSIAADTDPDGVEVARLCIVANRRAEAANPKWVEDVRARKLTIANGAGSVHGNHYDLEAQYGIGLEPVVG